jgi:hypothetical protein
VTEPDTIVVVTWLDAFSSVHGWTDLEEARAEAKEERIFTTAGLVVVDEPDRIAIGQSLGPSNSGPQVSDVIVIPRSAILTLTVLRKP